LGLFEKRISEFFGRNQGKYNCTLLPSLPNAAFLHK